MTMPSVRIGEIPLDTIYVGTRQRPVDEKKVADIAASITQVGLLQPIGVVELSKDNSVAGGAAYRLVFGQHRFEAMELLQRQEITASVLPPHLPDEAYLLMELQENSARNDLTSAQRMAYTGEIGRLLSRLPKNYSVTDGNEEWFQSLVKTTSVGQNTLYVWWRIFRQEAGISHTPRDATEAEKQQFFDWLEEQKRKEDEAKQQQADERKRQIQHEECESAVNHLANLAQMYGVEVVERQVIAVFQERFVRTSHA